MDELVFINVVLVEVDCDLLLDVNNVYVNVFNYGYDVDVFIVGLFVYCIVCLYVVGYFDDVDDFKIDIYGSVVIDLVWDLFGCIYVCIGLCFILFECDFNFFFYLELCDELCIIWGLMVVYGVVFNGWYIFLFVCIVMCVYCVFVWFGVCCCVDWFGFVLDGYLLVVGV